jgi:hypothetical protein
MGTALPFMLDMHRGFAGDSPTRAPRHGHDGSRLCGAQRISCFLSPVLPAPGRVRNARLCSAGSGGSEARRFGSPGLCLLRRRRVPVYPARVAVACQEKLSLPV